MSGTHNFWELAGASSVTTIRWAKCLLARHRVATLGCLSFIIWVFCFFPNNLLDLLGKLLYLNKPQWGWVEMIFRALSPPKAPQKVTCSLQSVILINQRGTALLCTHLNQDVFAFLINLSASIWEAFSYNQWKSAGKPKYLHRLYLMRSFRQHLTRGVTGMGIHPWKRNARTGKVGTPLCTHASLLSSTGNPVLTPHMWAPWACSARLRLRLQFEPVFWGMRLL